MAIAAGMPDIQDVARSAVLTLDEGQDPGPLPEEDDAWNTAFVSAVREQKERFRGSKDLRNLLRIAGQLLYGKDIHWAMELVQNAEDAGARRIVFVFEPSRVLVWNDGESFRAQDIWAICSAGHSVKRNKIGFFGIGFKSVYKLTEAPEIYSGPYALRIEDKLYPTPLPVRFQKGRGAWFVLPLATDQRSKLPSMVKALTSSEFGQVLLTMRSLAQIRVLDRTGSGASSRLGRRILAGDQHQNWDECEIGGTRDDSLRTWRRFFYETDPVPSGVSREGRSVEPGDRSVVVLARPVDGQPSVLRLHCFLPTAVRSELRWMVQADFEPSASREQLRQSEWNDWLMGEAGKAITQATTVSSRLLREVPWDLVPLTEEVQDPQQRIAFERASAGLKEASFIATHRGWRRPSNATWGLYPQVPKAVRESDLAVATGRDVSYVRRETMGAISETDPSRAEQVLEALGSISVSCPGLVSLFGSEDESFAGAKRDGSWWIAALGLIAKHGTTDEKEALAETRCLPIRGGGRVQPSPAVAEDGYLVAFSRADLSEDLQAFLGDSEVHLIEPFLSARGEGARSEHSAGESKLLADINAMLTAEPFNVAPEAGPYHIVASLVLPRLNSLARHDSLTDAQADQAWRLFEYVRQKWPTYVSEYRRRRNDKATDTAIAAELSAKLMVVSVSASGRHKARTLSPVVETYVSKALLGWEAMDVALAGDDQARLIDDTHARALEVSLRRRGGRVRGEVPPALDFLRLLGAPVGPRVGKRALVQLAPRDFPWIDWSSIPPGSRRRVGLEGDWDSPDLARLAVRWPSLSLQQRTRRAAALLRGIEADWPRLTTTAACSARYFYGSWTPYLSAVPTSWVGLLSQIEWLHSVAGTLERPADLVVDTPANRLASGGETRSLLKWRLTNADAIRSLGVRGRPAAERVLETLFAVRSGSAGSRQQDLLTVAKACYQTLSDEIRDAGAEADLVKALIVTRMRGGAGRGLIYAPPPDKVEGESWWPSGRVIQNDAMKWVGPYLGQLAGRYRSAAHLWETLAIRRDLTPDIACEVIRRDLSTDQDAGRAYEYYGRLVSFLEGSKLGDGASSDVPALTTVGWRSSTDIWWSNRPELVDAYATSVAWWQPGLRDPSSVRRAADFLGAREVTPSASGGPLTERWEIHDLEALEIGEEERWHLALATWPDVIRSGSDPSEWPSIEQLAEVADTLRPTIAGGLRVHFAFATATETIRVAIGPPVALRLRDGLVVARSASDLFTTQAAVAIATLVPTNQREAANTLALLLSNAAHDPDELYRRATLHAVHGYQHREFAFEPELDDVDVSAVERVGAWPKRRGKKSEDQQEPFKRLADPAHYGLVKTDSVTPAPPTAAGPIGNLVAPASEEDQDEESGGTKAPPEPHERYSNLDVEGAARPFVEDYELSTRGTSIVRQGPRVGADYVASDGRYIEVKAFSGSAPNSFDLEAPEWRAAQHPEIADRYWVYIVEHLRDGQPPQVTAVFNPVTDEATSKEPTGKMRVRGWRSSRTQRVGRFEQRP